MTKIFDFYCKMLSRQHVRNPSMGFDKRVELIGRLSEEIKTNAISDQGVSNEQLLLESKRLGVPEDALGDAT